MKYSNYSGDTEDDETKVTAKEIFLLFTFFKKDLKWKHFQLKIIYNFYCSQFF